MFQDVDPNGEKCFSALCLEFGFLYFHKETDPAIKGLEDLCRKQIEILLSEHVKTESGDLDIEAIVSEISNHNNEEYWEVYREVNFRNSLKQKKTADQPEILFDLIKQSMESNMKFRETYALN